MVYLYSLLFLMGKSMCLFLCLNDLGLNGQKELEINKQKSPGLINKKRFFLLKAANYSWLEIRKTRSYDYNAFLQFWCKLQSGLRTCFRI